MTKGKKKIKKKFKKSIDILIVAEYNKSINSKEQTNKKNKKILKKYWQKELTSI